MNKQHPILLFVILALLATAPFTNAQTQQPSEEQLARILKRFPEADTDKDGKLSTEEIEAVRQKFLKSRQRNRRPAAAAQPTQAGDAKLTETLAGGPDQETKEKFIKRVEKNTKKSGNRATVFRPQIECTTRLCRKSITKSAEEPPKRQ